MPRPQIDIHTHILPPALPRFAEKFGYGGFIEMQDLRTTTKGCECDLYHDDGRFFRTVQDNAWSPERRIEECQGFGIHRQVLSTVPVLFYYWTQPRDGLAISQFLNDHIAGVVAEHPGHFFGLGTVPLQDTDLAIQELERCMKDLGLHGVQIGTHVNGANLDDPRFFPFFAAAEQLSAALFVHPWDMLGKERMSQHWMPWLLGMPTETALAAGSLIFGGVLERLPRLRIALAHGGGFFPFLMGRWSRGFDTRPDLVATKTSRPPHAALRQLYVDSLVHEPRVLDLLINLMGPDRIAIGSDYPFPLGEARPGSILQSLPHLEADHLDWLTHKTALSWLGIGEFPFENLGGNEK